MGLSDGMNGGLHATCMARRGEIHNCTRVLYEVSEVGRALSSASLNAVPHNSEGLDPRKEND